MLDFQVAFDKLAQFETAEQIRQYFVAEGYKGVTCSESHCPIASFLRDQTGEDISVAPVLIMRGGIVNVELNTAAMQEFILNFDDEMYPELIIPAL